MSNMLNLRRVAAGLTAFSLLALSANAAATTPNAPDIPPTVRTALLEYAMNNAALHGDTHPYDIQAVRTTHKKAGSLKGGTGSNPPADTPVYVVAMRGHFICHCAPPRSDHHPVPPGSVITFEIIANTPELETAIRWSIGDRYPRLQAVGTPVHLQAPNAS
jgi:hypothetical protein